MHPTTINLLDNNKKVFEHNESKVIYSIFQALHTMICIIKTFKTISKQKANNYLMSIKGNLREQKNYKINIM